MTANGFTLLTSEERDKLYGISSKDNKNKKEDLLDAAFDMVCWLKENKKI